TQAHREGGDANRETARHPPMLAQTRLKRDACAQAAGAGSGAPSVLSGASGAGSGSTAGGAGTSSGTASGTASGTGSDTVSAQASFAASTSAVQSQAGGGVTPESESKVYTSCSATMPSVLSFP